MHMRVAPLPTKNSQLDLALLKLLQDLPPVARPIAGRELRHTHTSERLHEQEEPGQRQGLSQAPGAHPPACPMHTTPDPPMGVLPGVGEAEGPGDAHPKDQVYDGEWLGVQAAGHVVVLRRTAQVGQEPCLLVLHLHTRHSP